MSEVEEGVHVGEKLVADVHGDFGGVDDGGPDVGFLRDGGQGVVVAVEGEEGGELHPAVAELFVGVAIEAAGVDAEHGNAEKAEA